MNPQKPESPRKFCNHPGLSRIARIEVYVKDVRLRLDEYKGARYYAPILGRLSWEVDPTGFDPDNILSFNLYTYVNDNPYRSSLNEVRSISPNNLKTGQAHGCSPI